VARFSFVYSDMPIVAEDLYRVRLRMTNSASIQKRSHSFGRSALLPRFVPITPVAGAAQSKTSKQRLQPR